MRTWIVEALLQVIVSQAIQFRGTLTAHIPPKGQELPPNSHRGEREAKSLSHDTNIFFLLCRGQPDSGVVCWSLTMSKT